MIKVPNIDSNNNLKTIMEILDKDQDNVVKINNFNNNQVSDIKTFCQDITHCLNPCINQKLMRSIIIYKEITTKSKKL